MQVYSIMTKNRFPNQSKLFGITLNAAIEKKNSKGILMAIIWCGNCMKVKLCSANDKH